MSILQTLKHHFVPHAGNDYHPHFLQKTAMAMMSFLVILTFVMSNIQALVWVNVDWMVSAILPAVIVASTNDEREDDSLSELKRNPVLDQAAQMKAEHMAAEGYFAHYSPSGVSPWHWFKTANYNFIHAGENLAVHFTDSGRLVDAWMDSPTHRANIMNGQFTEIGIGVAEGEYEGYDTLFVVQMFGSPSLVPASAITETVAKSEPVPVLAVAEAEVAPETPQTAAVLSETTDAVETEVVEEEIMVEKAEVVPEAPIAASIEVPEVMVDFTDITPVVEESAEVPISTSTTDTTFLASEMLTTSTVLSTADAEAISLAYSEPSPAALLTQPTKILQFLYIVLGAAVLMTLLVSMAVEWRRQQAVQLIYSTALCGLMVFFWYVHILMTGSVIIA